jgi:hypothetical protein
VIKEPKKLKNNMGIIKEDAFEDVAIKNLKAIKNELAISNDPTVKATINNLLNSFANNRSLNDLDPKNKSRDISIVNKIHRTLNLKERIDNILNELLTEKLCPKGEAYRQRRLASGEKSSAYLSGRAVKVCKGLMSGKKK